MGDNNNNRPDSDSDNNDDNNSGNVCINCGKLKQNGEWLYK